MSAAAGDRVEFLGRSLLLSATLRLVAACIFASLSLIGAFPANGRWGGFESKVPRVGILSDGDRFLIHGQRQTVRMDDGLGSRLRTWMCSSSRRRRLDCGVRVLRQSAVFDHCADVSVEVRRGSNVLRGCHDHSVAARLIPALQLVTDTSMPEKGTQTRVVLSGLLETQHYLDPTEFSVRQWIYTAIVGLGILIGTVLLRRRPADLHAANGTGPQRPSSQNDCRTDSTVC